MPTRADLVQSAFNRLGLAIYVFDIEPEEYRDALAELDAMMAEWAGNGVVIGYLPANGDPDLTASAGTPDWATSGISANLALRMAPSYFKEPPQGLKGQARSGYDLALTKTATIPRSTMSTRTPKGAGNRWWSRYPYGNYYPSAQPDDA